MFFDDRYYPMSRDEEREQDKAARENDAALAEEIREYLSLSDSELIGYGLNRSALRYQLDSLANRY